MSLAFNPVFHDLTTGDKDFSHRALRFSQEIRVALVSGTSATVTFMINGEAVEEPLPTADGEKAGRFFWPGVESLSVSGDGKIVIAAYE